MTAQSEIMSHGGSVEKAAPLLSICIPTYNRSRFLDETLSSVEASLREGSAHVELIVSDNASPDNTTEVLETWRSRILNFKTHRHPENIGGEANFYFLLNNASGRYVWVLGDDDKMAPELIRELTERLLTNPDAVFCNYSVHSVDFSIKHYGSFFFSRESKLFHSRSEVLESCGVGASFISAIVLKTDNVRRVSKSEYDKYKACGLSFLYAVYASLQPDCRVEYLGKPLIYCRGNNSNPDWEKVFLDGVADVMRGLIALGYSVSSVRRAKNLAVRDYVLQRVGTQKVAGALTPDFLSRCFRAYKECPFFWCAAAPLALLPMWAIKLIRYVRNKVRGVRTPENNR